MVVKKPDQKETPQFLHYFIDLVETENLIEELDKGLIEFIQLLDSIPLELQDYQYKEGKWSAKQVLQHIIDCERLYYYRAFRFSRFDDTVLVGFDENSTMSRVVSKDLKLAQIKEEFETLRSSTIALFKSMSDEMLDFKGRASGVKLTARMLGYMAVGHCRHHLKFLIEYYL